MILLFLFNAPVRRRHSKIPLFWQTIVNDGNKVRNDTLNYFDIVLC